MAMEGVKVSIKEERVSGVPITTTDLCYTVKVQLPRLDAAGQPP